jgi:hypothetical protein
MIFRITVTVLMTFLTIYAFWSNAEEGGFFNPLGILFLILTILVWLAWRPICDAFRSAKAESELPILPIVRLGTAMIEGMRRPPREHRHSDDHS